MAENAERSIQDMIPEMREMERIGLFTAEETRKILKTRREFEYKLRRKTKEKKDFMQYIQYEQSVLELVKHRRYKRKCVGMKKEIDVCIIRRIHKLYELACLRFPGSLEVWKDHIAFCQNRKERSSVEKVFSQAMRLHPHNEDMWILWAEHEMTVNHSPTNARQLFQRALRSNPQSKRLYTEYFRMELLYCDRLRKRQQILNVVELQSQSTILKGEVAMVVYRNAAEIFPDDADLCLTFVKVCQSYEFTSWIVDFIYNDISKRFSANEVAMAAFAKQPLSAQDGEEFEAKQFAAAVKETCERFEDAVKKVPTDKMWEMYIYACVDMAKLSPTLVLSNWAVEHMMKVFLRAVEEDKVTENMGLAWVDMLMKTGQASLGLDVIPLLTHRFHQSLALWIRQLELQILCDVDADTILACLKEALKHLGKKSECVALWRMTIDWCLVSSPDKVVDLFEEGIVNGSRVSRIFIKEYYLDWAAQHLAIKSVRKLYKRLSAAPMSLGLLNKYVSCELSQPNPKMKKIRSAYDLAVMEFGSTNIDIWLTYLDLERKHPLGNPAAVGVLYERAKRTLKEPLAQTFIEQSISDS